VEISVPSIETVKLGWDWTLKNLQMWFQVLRKPADTLQAVDLQSTDALLTAIQFAVFPVVLSTVILCPCFLAMKNTPFGFVGFLVVSAVMYPTAIFLAAVAQRLSAFFVRGKGNFLACTIASLYATAFGW
jgi:hypothetical protein